MNYTDPEAYQESDTPKEEAPHVVRLRRRSGLPVAIIFLMPGLALTFYPFYAEALWRTGIFAVILAIIGFILLLIGAAGFCEEMFND